MAKHDQNDVEGVRIQKDELIALRAYALWIAEGHPDGRSEDHWHRARREIDRELSEPEREIGGHATPRARKRGNGKTA